MSVSVIRGNHRVNVCIYGAYTRYELIRIIIIRLRADVLFVTQCLTNALKTVTVFWGKALEGDERQTDRASKN